ncbi:unnamed protein product, partial [Allacma fusca]
MLPLDVPTQGLRIYGPELTDDTDSVLLVNP